MKRLSVKSTASRRFGFAHPHELNRTTGFRGGVRK